MLSSSWLKEKLNFLLYINIYILCSVHVIQPLVDILCVKKKQQPQVILSTITFHNLVYSNPIKECYSLFVLIYDVFTLMIMDLNILSLDRWKNIMNGNLHGTYFLLINCCYWRHKLNGVFFLKLTPYFHPVTFFFVHCLQFHPYTLIYYCLHKMLEPINYFL